jgi:MFS family permease
MFFFLTLYMQTVLHYSPIQTGAAYLPLTGAVVIASGISSQLVGRIGTKAVIVGGCLIGAGAVMAVADPPARLLRQRHPARPSRHRVRCRRRLRRRGDRNQRRCRRGQAGLAAGVLNTGGQDTIAEAATHGYQRALMAGAGFALAAAAVALLARSARETARSEPNSTWSP